ncbi:MAG: M20/M25/M40 family metallo-hydrolase [Phycisphaerales bacterium]|nr:M20/M25/M40 family metallo-hydrolase [Planctomycetota bacterium]MCH8508738.1 M20/M25/M40 family metallo-hydrolase [Phycisphaerales bacterium]
MGRVRSTGFYAIIAASGLLAACQTAAPRAEKLQPQPQFERFAVIDGERVPPPDIKMGDPAVIQAILEEGKNNTQVMALLTEMCETFGARLTGSAANEGAQHWALDLFRQWGLDAHLHEWGTIATRFDRGPSTGSVYRAGGGDRDKIRDMEFTTLSWSRGTDGPLRGPAIIMPDSLEAYEANAGSFEGAWVLLDPDYSGRRGIRSVGFLMREHMQLRHRIREQLTGPDPAEDEADRPAQAWSGTLDYNGSAVPVEIVLTSLGESPQGTMSIPNFHTGAIHDARLENNNLRFRFAHAMGTSEIELAIDGDAATGTSKAESGNVFDIELTRSDEPSSPGQTEFEDPILARVLAENPAGFISSSKDHRVWTTSANGWRERVIDDYPIDIEVNVRESDHDFITARLAQGTPVDIEFDLPHTLVQGPIPVYNVIAEIRGTHYPDEVIIISGHQDSWDGPGSQGTVDNGTGTAVAIEAARILSTVGVRPKRTIRFALWSGEEQGLLGSRAYVREMSAEELSKVSAMFVDDGGTNYQGGLPAADFMVDYLAAATSWSNGHFYSETDGEHMLVNIRPTGDRIRTHGGSDHAAFNAVGVPGFFWDEIGRADYRFAWHTQNDRLDQAIEEYLIQSATNSAITAYNLANAPGLLPRSAPETEAEVQAEQTAAAAD